MDEEEKNVINEKTYFIKSDKNNEYKIIFSVYDNEIVNLTLHTNNIFPKKKFNLSCSLEELLKNRFFKLFNNVDEVFRELENKIENSNIIEETNIIYLDIPIGLNIIKDIVLEIKQTEKNKEEINEELNNEINKLKNDNNQLQIEINNLKKTLTEKEEENKKLIKIVNNCDKHSFKFSIELFF